MWYVDFLELGNGDIYVGSTNDLKRRYGSHQSGQVVSTRPFLPVKLKCYIGIETEVHARQLERYFKSGSGRALRRSVFGRRRFVHSDLNSSPGHRDQPWYRRFNGHQR